jgi:hypothetical protein
MNKNVIKAVVLTVALTFSSVGYVDAKRMGSGKNIGQSAPVQKQAQPAQAQKPAQQAQPAAPAAGNAAAAAPKRPGFGGMLGGLAAGLGIAYLLSHFGLGEAAASFFTGLLIALAVGLLLLFILKRFMPSMSGAGRTSPAAAANNGMQRTAYEHGNARNEPRLVAQLQWFLKWLSPYHLALMSMRFWTMQSTTSLNCKKHGMTVIWIPCVSLLRPRCLVI